MSAARGPAGSGPVALYPGLGPYDASKCREGTCAARQCSIIEYADGSRGLVHRGAVCEGAAPDDPSHRYGGRAAKLVDGRPALVQTCRACKYDRIS